MMINCIIIEDQPLAQRILKKHISTFKNLSLMGCFSDVKKATEFMNTKNIDLIFLDIHLPKISGIEFLKSMPNHPKVMLTTAYSKYALESYQYNVIDYLLKPISYERFSQAIHKLELENTEEVSETIIVKSGYDLFKIEITNILYIKSDSDYTEIVTFNKKHLSTNPLKYWLEKLETKNFHRTHKSYIINTTHLSKVIVNTVHLVNGTELPLGRAYKKTFIESI